METGHIDRRKKSSHRNRDGSERASASSEGRIPWIRLLRIREAWGLVTAKFLSDAAWYFYLFWLPKYLYDARGFDIKAVGAFAWIPNAAAGVGCLVGGGFSSYLVRRTILARRSAETGARAERRSHASCHSHSACGSFVGHRALQPRVFRTAILVDAGDGSADGFVSAQRRGSVAGLVGFGGAMGGIAFGELVGYLLDHGFGYGIVSPSRERFT